MSVIAIDKDAIIDYSLKEDDGNVKVIFKLGTLDAFARGFIYSNENKVEMGFNSVKIGLKGWENFKDKDGKNVEFKLEEKLFPIIGKRYVITDESLGRLKFEWIMELASEILTNNTLNENDKKK